MRQAAQAWLLHRVLLLALRLLHTLLPLLLLHLLLHSFLLLHAP